MMSGVMSIADRMMVDAGGKVMGEYLPPTAPSNTPSTASTPEGITQAEWLKYQSKVMPMIENHAKYDNSASKRVDAHGASLVERTEGQIRIANGRRIGTMTPAQQRMVKNALAGGASASAATSSTAARLSERDIADGAMVESYNRANQLGNTGLSMLTQGTNMRDQRIASNKANKKSFMSSALSLVGTVAGGMIGGPIGASLGGAIGGAIGGG
jgi:hypothetical protein